MCLNTSISMKYGVESVPQRKLNFSLDDTNYPWTVSG